MTPAASLRLDPPPRPPGERSPEDVARARARARHLLGILDEARASFSDALEDDDAARDYLSDLGISMETARAYGTGSPGGAAWYALEHLAVEDLAAAGLVKRHDDGSFSPSFEDVLLLPVRTRRGRTVGFIAHSLTSPGESAARSFLSPESMVFHHDRECFGAPQAMDFTSRTATIVAVRDSLTVLALAERGIRHAVAPLTSPATASALGVLAAGCPRIAVVCPGGPEHRDSVSAILDAAVMSLNGASEIGLSFLPRGCRDAAALVETHGVQAIDALAARAMPALRLLARRLLSETDASTPAQDLDMRQLLVRGSGTLRGIGSESVRARALQELEVLLHELAPNPAIAPAPRSNVPPDPRAQSQPGTSDPASPEAKVTSPPPPAASPANPPAGPPRPVFSVRVAPSYRPTGTSWIDAVLATELFESRRVRIGRAAPARDLVHATLLELATNGGRASSARLADVLGLAPMRVPGMVSSLRRILNVDAVAALAFEQSTGTVILDPARLCRIFATGRP